MGKIYWKRKQDEQFIMEYATVSYEVYAYWSSMSYDLQSYILQAVLPDAQTLQEVQEELQDKSSMSDDLQIDILQAVQASQEVQEELQDKIKEQLARERDFFKDFDSYIEEPYVSNGLESVARLSRKRGYEISEESEEDTQQNKFLRVDGHDQQVSDLMLLEEMESIITLSDGSKVELSENQKAQWNNLPTHRQDKLKQYPKGKVLEVLKQKVVNARKSIITLSDDRTLQLNINQRAQWNKLPSNEKKSLTQSLEEEVLKALNQKDANARKSRITLSGGNQTKKDGKNRCRDEMSTSVSCPEGTSIAFSSIIEDQGRSNSS